MFTSLRLLLVLGLALVASWVRAQRMQFPTPIADSPYGYGGGIAPNAQLPPFYGAPAGVPGGISGPITAPPPAWDPYGDPFAGTAGGQPILAPGGYDTPIYPPLNSGNAGGGGSLFSGSSVNPGGGGPLGTGGWGAVNDPYYAGGRQGPGFFSTARRLMQDIGLRETYIGGSGTEKDFQTNDIDMWVTFVVPTPIAPRQPLFITPGFGIHLWEGPLSPNDLPKAVYDAYLNTGWKPRFGQRFGADVDFRIGVYSDFEFVAARSVRLQGGGVGLYQINPNWQFALGAYYINRFRVKLLPAMGVIWTPDPDTRLELLFPRPKIARRIPNFQNTELWGYISGEYGGGAWTVERDGPLKDSVDYNDMRLILGIQGQTYRGLRGHLEVGYVFNREVFFTSNHTFFEPRDTVMLRFGLAY